MKQYVESKESCLTSGEVKMNWKSKAPFQNYTVERKKKRNNNNIKENSFSLGKQNG